MALQLIILETNCKAACACEEEKGKEEEEKEKEPVDRAVEW